MAATLTALDAFLAPLTQAIGVRHGAFDSMRLFVLAMARWLPVVSLAPFLGGRLVINPVRMGLAMLLSLFVLPWMSLHAPMPLALGTITFWGMLLRELVLGVTLGIAAGLVVWGAEMGGSFLDTARGGTIANAMVPFTQIQSSVLGNLYLQLFVVLFLAIGGHRMFLGAVFDSYDLLSPFAATGYGTEGLAYAFIDATARALVLAAQLVAPALVVVIFLDVALGLANRLAPQFNVFFLSLPLKSAAALLMVGLSLRYMLDVGARAFEQHHVWLLELLRSMRAEGG